MKELNLSELLKDHEEETFYCSMCGDCNVSIDEECGDITIFTNTFTISLNKFGKLLNKGEVLLFPSKNQKDWEKWKEEQKAKVIPKTWKELAKQFDKEKFPRVTNYQIIAYDYVDAVSPALELAKIKQLIEAGYGGNITKEEWEDPNVDKYVIDYCPNDNKEDKIKVGRYSYLFNHIAFHTREQAKKFLSYDENIQLLKNFYAI